MAAGDAGTLKRAYAFNDFFFDDDPTWGSNEHPGAARPFLRSELHAAHAAGFYLAPNVEWVPRWFDVDNSNTVQTLALLGVRAGYEHRARWSVYVDAGNLADEKYSASASVVAAASPGSANFEPGDCLALFTGVM